MLESDHVPVTKFCCFRCTWGPGTPHISLVGGVRRQARAPISACYEGFCDFYSEADIVALVAYGRANGVRLVPSTGAPACLHPLAQ